MIEAGFETTDLASGTRIVLVEGTQETESRGWVREVHCPEGAGPWILEHVHATWTETFEIVRGSATYRLGGTERRIEAGQSVVMPPNVKHIHPWNTGKGEMVYRQISDFGDVDPTALDDVIGGLRWA